MSGEGALSGIRVLEAGGSGLEYAGKLFSNLGADVVKLEPAGGDPGRHHRPLDLRRPAGLQGLVFNYHNAGKRSVILDGGWDTDALVQLARWSDVILTDWGPAAWDDLGAPWEELQRRHPDLVLVSVTGFGLSGPRQSWRSADIVALAAGGLLAQTGEPEGPPYQLAGSQAFQTAGAYAAASALIALAAVDKGLGGQVVDVSLQEAVAALTTLVGVPKMLADGVAPRRQRNGRASGGHPTGLYTTSDGLVSLSLSRPAMWPILASWIHEVTGNEEVLDPMFEGSGLNRQEHADLIDIFIEEMTSKFTAQHLFHEGQRRGLAFALVSTPEDLLHDPHFGSRQFWVQVEGENGVSAGPPFRMSRTPWSVKGPAPAAGEHTREVLAEAGTVARSPVRTTRAPAHDRGALAGLRIVEFTVAAAGPWVGRHLAYHGAEVIRVEARGHPDHVRMFVPPWDPDRRIDPQASPWLAEWNAGKYNVALNVKTRRGLELARRLCLSADVVVENHRPGFLDRCGLGYESLSADRPELIMMSMQGYGTWGPYRDFLSWGYNLEPMAGLATFSGGPARPVTSPIAYPDWLAGLHGVVAVTAALRDRGRTGLGQNIELPQVETALSAVGSLFRDYAANGTTPERIGNHALNWAPQGVYRGSDRPGHNGPEDTWLAMAITSEAQWQSLSAYLGEPDWPTRYPTVESRLADQDPIDNRISEWMVNRDVSSTARALQELGIPAYAALDCQDLADDLQLRARNYFVPVPHASKGEELVTGLAGRFSSTATGVERSGGAVGSDNREVFCGLLGLSEAEFSAGVAEGAIEES